MYKQMNLTDLMAAVQSRIETGTTLKCYDIPPENEPAPLVIEELVALTPADTKTMFCKDYTIYLHIIAEEKRSSVPINNYIQAVQEAMTEDITIPEGFELVNQTDGGIAAIQTDESGEKHAVLVYTFRICYGYKVKQ